MTSVHDFSATTIDGREVSLAEYKGKALLVVNVASRCGFTPQYAGLEKLYRTLGPDRFVVLGFPCNQFGGQEPGTEEQIAGFCSTTYDVTFPMFAKVEVNGDGAHKLFKFLKAEKRGVLGTEGIKWNFTKFLVDGEGRVVERYGSNAAPESLKGAIEALIG